MVSCLNEREVHGHCDCARRIMTIGASCDATPAIEMCSGQQTTQSEQNDASKGRHRSVTAAGTSTGNNPASRMSWSSRCSRFADRDSTTGPAELPLLDIAYAATFCRPPPSGSRHRPLYGCLLSSLDASFGCVHSQCSSARQCLSLQLLLQCLVCFSLVCLGLLATFPNPEERCWVGGSAANESTR